MSGYMGGGTTGDRGFAGLLVFVLALALLGILLHPLILLAEGQRDPDGDGIPTARDPHPYEFDGELDADSDGWTNGYELLTGTDLRNPDQDHDMLPDGGDADGDGLDNWFEHGIAGLDPLRRNERFYIQLSSFPLQELDEEWNRRYWMELQGLPAGNYIVRYSLTFSEFMEIAEDLRSRADGDSLVFIFLKTHGSAENTEEPVLCFASASAPERADICGEYLSYRELDAILDRIPCRYMAIAYSSCAGSAALDLLEGGGLCPRVTLSLMGSPVKPPAHHARELAEQRPRGFLTLADYLGLLLQSGTPSNRTARDPQGIADAFYFGDLPNALLLSG